MEPVLPDSARTDPPEANFLGSLGKLDSSDRLIVPAELRQAISWLKGKGPIRLIAELRETGRVRFHPLDRASGALVELRAKLNESHPHSTEALAVLCDRYREVTYYPSDTRIHLPPAVSVYLRPTEPEDAYYIEGRGTHLDVMTLTVRNERLKLFMNDLDLSTEREL